MQLSLMFLAYLTGECATGDIFDLTAFIHPSIHTAYTEALQDFPNESFLGNEAIHQQQLCREVKSGQSLHVTIPIMYNDAWTCVLY